MQRPDLDRLILGWRGPALAALIALIAGLPGLIMTPCWTAPRRARPRSAPACWSGATGSTPAPTTRTASAPPSACTGFRPPPPP
ncbi:hypothetical protein [Brevundimonas denitrificans]|uniref:hypothetical protein n=1 Tax=Brevundimonas denitrificans TaxID=1443434 RepID=UPI00223C3685|nr:hypothetical protein [Brevundimonas denitrificans]